MFSQEQKSVDSLKKILSNPVADTQKVQVLNKISKTFYSYNVDSALFYSNTALQLAQKINYHNGVKTSLINKADALFYKGFPDSSRIIKEKIIEICKKDGDEVRVGNCLNDIGYIYREQGDASKALDYFHKALKVLIKIGDSEGLAASNLYLGITYSDMQKNDEAIEFLNNAMQYFVTDKNEVQIANTYARIGNVFWNKKEYPEAIKNYNQSLAGFTKINHKRGIAVIYNNLGGVSRDMGKFEKAKEYFEKGIKIRTEIGDQNGVSILLTNLGDLMYELKKYSGAIEYYDKALAITKNLNYKDSSKEIYLNLSKSFAKLDNYEKAYKYHLLFSDLNDSIYNETSSKQIAEMMTKYETEKKQKAIELLNKEKQLQTLEIDKNQEQIKTQKLIIFIVLGIVILIIAFSIFLIKLYTDKRKANDLLKFKNAEISQQKEEIEAQRDHLSILTGELQQQKEEIEAQRDEITAQRDIVLSQKEKIEIILFDQTQSINYAKRIQQALLPDFSVIARKPQADGVILKSDRKIAPHPFAMTLDYFVLFRPKDIVSGDFYWATNVNNILIIAVADCTGHGVPGGFMSMLGISFLNEIVRRQEVRQANQVLNHLRNEIINALQLSGKIDEQLTGLGTVRDGMDMSLIAIDTQPQAQTSESLKPSEVLRAYSAQWAGANNPLYVIARNEITKQSISGITSPSVRNDEIELYELKGDKMPIAIYERMDEFTNHELKLYPGDSIYLMSDGYQDQFGGPKSARGGKKFLSKNLKQLLIDNCRLNMNEQREILEKTLVGWIGDGEQIDDITMLGLKL